MAANADQPLLASLANGDVPHSNAIDGTRGNALLLQGGLPRYDVAPIPTMDTVTVTPTRDQKIAQLNQLFDQPLDPSISDAELASLEHDYAPQLTGQSPIGATTVDTIEVVGHKETTASWLNAYGMSNINSAPWQMPGVSAGQNTATIVMVNGKRVNTTPNIDYDAINNRLGTSIDAEFLEAREGGVYLDSYVPWSTRSGPRNGSGVTLVGGLDLGSKDRAYFSNAGVQDDLIDQLSPAFGKKRAVALEWNRANQIHLTPEEGDILQTATVENETRGAIRIWERNKAQGQPVFGDLTSQQQTIFMSRYFNAGAGGVTGMYSNFYSNAFSGNWNSASHALQTYSTLPLYREWSSRLILESGYLGH